jgi:novobiocin biosynthesis protein NovU/D-mycarose 3-C-methyltransferase
VAEPVEVLSLGNLPPANAYLSGSELGTPEPRFPLSLRLCRNCGLVQLGHIVPPDRLFRSYLFFTSSSHRMSEHFAGLMNENVQEFVTPGGLVVEIGSNDGTALTSVERKDVRTLGVDPSRNIAVMAAARGVPTIAEFFTEELANEVARVAGPADLIVGCNVLGHIDDLDDVCRGLNVLLATDGAFVFEVPYLGEMVDRLEYDTIYHEHLSYFAVRPLAHLFARHGLRLERVEFFPVHGGSIRGTVVRGEGSSSRVEELVALEIERGLDDLESYRDLQEHVEAQRTALHRRLSQLRSEGAKVIGYGAPAKGTVVLNYCDIDIDLLPVVLDSTPAKQGLHIPGTHQPILPPSALKEEGPDVLLLLAWNHAEEILRHEVDFRATGGRFLTPHLIEM